MAKPTNSTTTGTKPIRNTQPSTNPGAPNPLGTPEKGPINPGATANTPNGTTPVAVATDGSKKGRQTKPKHPLATGKNTLTETPPDFNFADQARLVIGDFVAEWQFFLYRAQDCEFNRKRFIELSDESKNLGSKAEQSKSKKLAKMQGELASLTAELKGQGLDIDALLAAGKVALEKEEATKAAKAAEKPATPVAGEKKS